MLVKKRCGLKCHFIYNQGLTLDFFMRWNVAILLDKLTLHIFCYMIDISITCSVLSRT